MKFDLQAVIKAYELLRSTVSVVINGYSVSLEDLSDEQLERTHSSLPHRVLFSTIEGSLIQQERAYRIHQGIYFLSK